MKIINTKNYISITIFKLRLHIFISKLLKHIVINFKYNTIDLFYNRYLTKKFKFKIS